MANDEKKVAQPLKEEPKQQDQGGDKGDIGRDVLDPTADTKVYPADIGYSVTSHGDGSPTIAPQLVERRAELKERNSEEGVDAENRKVARELGLLKD